MGIVHEASNIYTDLTAWHDLVLTAELYDIRRAGSTSNSSACGSGRMTGRTGFTRE